MVDTQSIDKLITDSGLKREFIADKMGITRQTLTNKINGNVDFYSKEILSLCEVLGISDRDRNKLFFANNVTKSSD